MVIKTVIFLFENSRKYRVSQVVLPASTGDIRDMGSIPGSGRSLREGNSNPCTEEVGGLQFIGS